MAFRDANGTRQRDRACSTLLRLICCSVVASYPASCLPLMATRPAKGETVYCWHIHVYFLERNEASTANALALRNDFISQFFARRLSTEPASTFRPCTAEVNDYLCLWGYCFRLLSLTLRSDEQRSANVATWASARWRPSPLRRV